MRNLKRFLAVLVVIAVMASSMVTAFAAAPSDVKGTAYETAVTRLAALGVLNGYPDGTFKPEGTITRAEFAKVVVESLGLGAVAKLSAGTTSFKDVDAKSWASGYINLASSLKIVNGYGNGKFGPNDKVQFEQAITMLVRALGYEPAAINKGGYPQGYLLQAYELGITADVNGVSGIPASRGIVALLVNNSLGEPMMVQTGYTGNVPTYVIKDDVTFLSKLGYSKVEAYVTKTPSVGADAGTFVAGGNTYKATAGVDAEALLGSKARLWTKGTDVVLTENIQDPANIVTVKSVSSVTSSSITVVNAADETKTYTKSDATAAVWNFAASTVGKVATEVSGKLADQYDVTLTVDNGVVVFAKATTFAAPATALGNYRVNNVLKTTTAEGWTLKDGDNAVKSITVIKNGKAASIADLKAGDIYMLALNDGASGINDDIYYIVATDAKVSGEFQAATPSTSAAVSIKVGGTTYDKGVFAASNFLSNVAFGDTVEVKFDLDGKILSVAKIASAATTADQFGVVTAVQEVTSWGTTTVQAKVVTADGSVKVYNLANTATVTTATALPAFISYHVDANGNIDLTTIDANPTTTAAIDADRLKLGTEYVKSTIKIFNLKDDGSYEVIGWDKLADNGTLSLIGKFSDSGELVAIYVTSITNPNSVSDFKYAIVTGVTQTSAGNNYSVSSNGSTSTVVTGATLANGTVIEYKLNSDGSVSVLNTPPVTTSGAISEVGSNRIKVNGNYYYFASDMQIVYDAGRDGAELQPLTTANLYADEVVDVILVGGDIKVLIVKAM